MSPRSPSPSSPHPNVVFLFADQHRRHATGYAGNPVVHTPHLDALAAESVNFTHAVSGCPVCSPFRASLLTGTHPLTHGVFLNDVPLRRDNLAAPGETTPVFLAEAFRAAGYETAYVGKWHVDGFADASADGGAGADAGRRGAGAGAVGSRSAFIPAARRQGFEYWKVLECTHDYFHSRYWDPDDALQVWEGYDAFAQTRDAMAYIRAHARAYREEGHPFCLFLSWGPPHAPYLAAPPEYLARYDDLDAFPVRPNVPPARECRAVMDLVGYYAHVSALDACVGQIVAALDACGLSDDTILVYTSDHGDMLHSHGQTKKQSPWDESIRVPFLLRYPARVPPWASPALINAPDVMPTLLGLCGIPVPPTVEGVNLAPHLLDPAAPAPKEAALLACVCPFAQWSKTAGGREYRGLRTRRYTYARDRAGPWLLYDNQRDPFQRENLVNRPEVQPLQARLEALLAARLAERGDEFAPGKAYLAKWGYPVGPDGAVPYRD